ncbi:MAG: 4Fe-4S binding protein [Candidatus Thorarchaeota archaeon]
MAVKQRVNVEELRTGGVVKLREEDMFSIWVKTACCNLTSSQLRKIADITDDYARGQLLFTTRQIPIIPFVNLRDVEEVKRELGKVYLELDRCGARVRNINVCYDDKICPEATTNSLSLAEKLENFFNVPMTHKVKIGVAGCKKDCIGTRALTDIGFVGVERGGKMGYDAYVGGKLGVSPFIGVRMAKCLPEEECEIFVQNAFDLLKNEGKEEERCADLIARLGARAVGQKLTRGLHKVSPLTPVECATKQREKGTDKMIVRVRATCGEVTSKQLRRIADVAEQYGKGFVHFVIRGSPEIPCVHRKRLEDIRKELQEVDMQILDRGIDNLQSCFGNYCTESVVDPQSLLRRIERRVEELGLDNLDLRVSAAGCPNSCGIAHLNDIGFHGVIEPEVNIDICSGCELCVAVCKRAAIRIEEDVAVIDKGECKHCGRCIAVCPSDAISEKRRGFAVLVGGREGEDTRLGEVIAEFLSEEEAFGLADTCLRILQERNATAATTIDEIGVEKFREVLFGNSE